MRYKVLVLSHICEVHYPALLEYFSQETLRRPANHLQGAGSLGVNVFAVCGAPLPHAACREASWQYTARHMMHKTRHRSPHCPECSADVLGTWLDPSP